MNFRKHHIQNRIMDYFVLLTWTKFGRGLTASYCVAINPGT